jgi:hypothetical protein
MKRIFILTAFILIALQSTSYSQVMGSWTPFLNAGLKLGVNYQTISGAPVKANPGAVAGGYVRKDVYGRFGIRVEALGCLVKYTTKYPAAFYTLHTPGMDTITKGVFQAIYVNVPLLIEYRLSEQLQVMAGPQYGYIVSFTDNNNAYSKIYGNTDFITTSDFSMVAGIEYAINKRVSAELRLTKGVTDVNNSTYYLVVKKWSTSGIQASVSYKIL